MLLGFESGCNKVVRQGKHRQPVIQAAQAQANSYTRDSVCLGPRLLPLDVFVEESSHRFRRLIWFIVFVFVLVPIERQAGSCGGLMFSSRRRLRARVPFIYPWHYDSSVRYRRITPSYLLHFVWPVYAALVGRFGFTALQWFRLKPACESCGSSCGAAFVQQSYFSVGVHRTRRWALKEIGCIASSTYHPKAFIADACALLWESAELCRRQ